MKHSKKSPLFLPARLLFRNTDSPDAVNQSAEVIAYSSLQEIKNKVKGALGGALRYVPGKLKGKMDQTLQEINACKNERDLFDVSQRLLRELRGVHDKKALGSLLEGTLIKMAAKVGLKAMSDDYDGGNPREYAIAKVCEKFSATGFVQRLTQGAEANIEAVKAHPEWRKLLGRDGKRIDHAALCNCLFSKENPVLTESQTHAFIERFYSETPDVASLVTADRGRITESLRGPLSL